MYGFRRWLDMGFDARHGVSKDDFRSSVQARSEHRKSKDRRIILTHGETVQVLRIAPWMGLFLLLIIVTGAIAVIGSASYLFFRDELFTASIKRQYQIQVAYEDRISELRRQIDRITSRQLLNQQSYEARVERLLAEHVQLYEQGARLNVLLDRAGSLGLVPRPAPPSPVIPPNQQADLGTMTIAPIPDDALITGSVPQLPLHRGMSAVQRAVADPAGILTNLDDSLQARAHNQLVALAGLAMEARAESDTIADQVASLGIRLPRIAQDAPPSSSQTGMGGPLLPPRGEADPFDLYVDDTARSLEDLQLVRAAVDDVPILAPARNARLTSRFGNRRDPFTRRTAFHAGIDYAAPRGTPIYAPADGVVTRAARRGGYGLMIELDHEHGLSTRFAHLSRMHVSVGQHVRAGDLIGRIGSTGRSTGPHLHYEVRRGTRAVDPMPYVRAGQELADLL